MCGIAGWLGTWPDNERIAARIVHALRHRGPDGHGTRSWPEATLIHTRLSIIDLSSAVAFSSATSWASVRTNPSWATFTSKAFRRFRRVSKSWRSQMHRTPGRGDRDPSFPELIGDLLLSPGRLLQGQPNNRLLHFSGNAVLQYGFLAGNFL